MTAPVVSVRDLVGAPGRSRPVSGEAHAELDMGHARSAGPVEIDGEVTGTVDGVHARFRVSGAIELTCVRCLSVWGERRSVSGSQHFSPVPDEDGYRLAEGAVDLTGPAVDEFALALPAAPVCREGCRGLCPTCGTDLNDSPCDGHEDLTDSPFAALRDLFDPE